MAGPGVAGDVGQRLLGDAIEHDLDVLAERAAVGVEVAVDGTPLWRVKRVASAFSALASPSSTSVSGAGRGAMRRTSSRLRRAPSRACSRSPSSGARIACVDLQQHAGQRLAELVVQLARHPPALVLLGANGAAGALAALVLQAVEHVVERLGQLLHLVGARARVQTRARASGSIVCMSASGAARARRRAGRAARWRTIVATTPGSSTTSSRVWIGELTVAGPSARARLAASRTAELSRTTRHARDISRDARQRAASRDGGLHLSVKEGVQTPCRSVRGATSSRGHPIVWRSPHATLQTREVGNVLPAMQSNRGRRRRASARCAGWDLRDAYRAPRR